MEVQFELNGKPVCTEIEPGAVLFDILRSLGCYSVKCGCETTNCGLCTVWVDGTPRLSCSILAARAAGCKITTLEGLQEEATRFGAYLAAEGAEQCTDGKTPNREEIREYLAGNLCRCTGYAGQLRAVEKYLRERRG